MELGYEFQWKPFAPPALTYPSGKKITLRVESYLPVLDAEVSTAAHYDAPEQIFAVPVKVGTVTHVSLVAPVGVGHGAAVADLPSGLEIEDGPPREDEDDCPVDAVGVDAVIADPLAGVEAHDPRRSKEIR